MADTYHLQRRGSNWYYVRRVPADLIERIGKPILKQSLDTASKIEAKRKRSVLDVEMDQQFAKLRNGSGALGGGPSGSDKVPPTRPSSAHLIEQLRAFVEAEDAKSKQRLAVDPPNSQDELTDLIADAEIALEIMLDPNDDRQLPTVVTFGKKVLAKAGVGSPNPEEVAAFNSSVRRALIELFRREISRYRDRHDREWFDALFDPLRRTPVSLRVLADDYIEQQRIDYDLNGISAKRFDKVKGQIDTLVDILGPDRPVADIDDDAIQKVRQVLAALPTNRKKLYPGLSLEKSAKSAKEDGRRTLSPTTQQQYLDDLRGMLSLAVRRKLLSSNSAASVRPLKKDHRAPHEKRLPLTSDQLKQLFTSSFYQSCAPGSPTPYTKPDHGWRMWLPLIMLFSGARPNEIAQLRVADLKKSAGGTWYLDLTGSDDGGLAKQFKTEASRRRIPVHSELVKCGLLRFFSEREQANGPSDLFPTLKPNKYGNRAWYPAKRFNEVFMPKVMQLGPDQSLYSLRHNVRDALRAVAAPPEALRAITGWSDGKQGSDHYGDPGNPDFYGKWVDAIAYPGVDLTFLHTL